MKLTESRLRSIVREELVRERVGSKTLSPRKLEDVVRNYLKREYGRSMAELVEVYDHDFKLEVIFPEEILNKENWNQFFKRYGYFIKDVFGQNDGYENVEIHIMPYDTKRVSRDDLPVALRHATPKNKLLKVFRNGLVPNKTQKVGAGVDEARVYFSVHGEKFDQLVKQLKRKIPEKPPFGNEIARLRVLTTEMPDDVKFYSDPEVLHDDFVYTNSNIPPEAILNKPEFEEEIEILKNRK